MSSRSAGILVTAVPESLTRLLAVLARAFALTMQPSYIAEQATHHFQIHCCKASRGVSCSATRAYSNMLTPALPCLQLYEHKHD